MTGLLDGVRVLDCTRMLAGPYASMILADLGCEVIKVEEPGGDPIRAMGPPWRGDQSAYFLAVNRGKRSVTLDLADPAGRALFLELVAVSDVVLDNYRAGVTDRLGIAPQDCRAVRPDIVTCSVTAFGAEGPYRDLPAFDLVLQALGGGMSVTGPPDGPPVRMGLPVGDLAGGVFAALGVVTALLHRARTGVGRHVDLALLDVQVSLLTYLAGYHWADGRVPGPQGNGHETVVPYDAFQGADGAGLVVAVFTERFWEPFCRVLDVPGLLERWPTNAQRLAGRHELEKLLAARFAERPAAEWVERLRAAGVPVAPVHRVDQVLTDPQVLARGMVATTQPHPTAGAYPVLGDPLQHTGGGPRQYAPAPLLGQHTDEVIGGLLGHSAAEIAQWRRTGVV